MTIRTYSELISFPTFLERYNYLRLDGQVGQETFGFDRYINQVLYQSRRWRIARDAIIVRDEALDLAHPDFPINGKIVIHHLNPITLKDLEEERDCIFEPDLLVCVSHSTHNAIHYGDQSLLPRLPVIRQKGDTCPWKD